MVTSKFADAEQADDRDEEADSGEQFVEAEGQPQVAGIAVHADGSEGKAESDRYDGLERRGAAETDEAGRRRADRRRSIPAS